MDVAGAGDCEAGHLHGGEKEIHCWVQGMESGNGRGQGNEKGAVGKVEKALMAKGHTVQDQIWHSTNFGWEEELPPQHTKAQSEANDKVLVLSANTENREIVGAFAEHP